MLAGTSQVGSKRIRARTAGAGVAREFVPKHNRERIDIRGWRADAAERPEIGEMRDATLPPGQDLLPSRRGISRPSGYGRRERADVADTMGVAWRLSGLSRPQGFLVISLPEGEITYQRPPLRFSACPAA